MITSSKWMLTQIADDEVHPDVHVQGHEEGEDAGGAGLPAAEEDADAQVHVRHREVYIVLPLVVDGQGCHRQIRLLQQHMNN